MTKSPPALILCKGCAAFLPASSFDPSSVREYKHQCKACRAHTQRLYRERQRTVFLAANLRRLTKMKTSGCAPTFSAADAGEVLKKYEGRCIITGEADITKLTLVRLREDEPLSVDNVAPVAKKAIRLCRSLLVTRGLASESKEISKEQEGNET